MAERKTKGRFTIQFNLANPQQASASELLDQQGRHKAQFLANAIHSYVSREAMGGMLPSATELEKQVKEIIDQYLSSGPKNVQGWSKQHTDTEKRSEEVLGFDYSAAEDTLLAFEKSGGSIQ